ncbi:His-Xaa-Ser system protein HxsD [Salinisphaera hydrothermalis]|uniref:His-Xaa-Ser system protein HxsD n=1 Tax=Salinisphaera hydrothermalis TaxID=563188 RepID=UPI003341CD7B
MAREAKVPLSAVQNAPASRVRDIPVCLKAFDLATVKATCYRFAAQGYRSLSVDESGDHAVVTFAFPGTVSPEAEETRVEQFQQALLDQDLRRQVSEKTTLARQLILANAFADTALVDRDDA